MGLRIVILVCGTFSDSRRHCFGHAFLEGIRNDIGRAEFGV